MIRAGSAVAAAAALAYLGPSVTALLPVRTRLFPGLSGLGDPGHVALTFDDGPDPDSTPYFLDELHRHDVRATFFVLGVDLARQPGLGRAIASAGHELAVHGWTHRHLFAAGPVVAGGVRRTRTLIEDVAGQRPRWYRPPYGVLTAPAMWAARSAGLVPVLWTCWGRDWTRSSTKDSVVAALRGGLRPGATVLLHDSDRAAAPGSWRSALAALPVLLDDCDRRGLTVGPLAEHGVAGR